MGNYCVICGKSINADYDWESICLDCEEESIINGWGKIR